MAKRLLFFFFTLFAFVNYQSAVAQNPLPDFSVKDIGKERYVISWVNSYPVTSQITIQRSFDSTRGFKSILTVPDPAAKQNGFADTKATNDHMFYRLYILLQNGDYLFTAAKQPIKEVEVVPLETKLSTPPIPKQPIEQTTTKEVAAQQQAPIIKTTTTQNSTLAEVALTNTKENIPESTPSPAVTTPIEVKRVEPIVYKITPARAGDSAKIPTAIITKDEPNAFAPSLFVYAHPDGNIRVQVPNRARLARYRIKFFEADKRFLFELKNLPAPSFQLDKTNFLHAGWFLFELYEDSRLIEKHKVYLEKS